jgi:diacylglycerol kinase (ATP)
VAYTVVLNAGAGKASPEVAPETVAQMAAAVDLDVRVLALPTGRDVQSAVQRLVAEGEKTVIVGGGDGTVAGAVRVVADTGVTLGILPMGSANNFAAALNIPLHLPSALANIRYGLVRTVSLGKVEAANGESRLFVESAGIGLFADGLALYGEGGEGLGGTLHGLGVLLQLVKEFRAHPLRLYVDDSPEPLEEAASICTVANSYRMGAFVAIAPEASLTDDFLDVVLVGDISRTELLRYYQAAQAGEHLELPKVKTLRVRKIRIETAEETPLNVHADDTVIGRTPATISLMPAALKTFVGSEVRDDL